MTGYVTGELVPATAGPQPRAELADRTDPQHIAIRNEWLLSMTSPHTRAAYRREIALYFDWCAEFDIDPLHVTPFHADGYREYVTGQLPKKSSQARRLSAVSSFYKFAMVRHPRLNLGNPFDSIKRPRAPKGSETVGLTMEQVIALFHTAKALGPREHCIAQVLLATGMRVSELVNANTWDLRREGDYTTIRITRKGAKDDRVVLSPEAVQAIHDYVEKRTGPILTSRNGGRVTRQQLAREIGRLSERAGVPRLHPHMLRHTAATLAIKAGVPIERVQEMLGHADITTTMRYYHAVDRLENSAVHGLAAAYREALAQTAEGDGAAFGGTR